MPTTPTPNRVLVLGGTGSIGRVVVERLSAHGIPARVLSRHPEKAGLGADAEVVAGDLTDPGTLRPALEGVDAVILTHGAPYGSGRYEQIDYGAVPALLEALDGREVRVALMSSIGVTGEDGPELLTWKRRGERLLRATGLPHTIVRPGWFDAGSDEERGADLRQGDGTDYGPARRMDIAEALVQAVLLEEALGRTVELFSVTGDPVEDWAGAFGATRPDVPGALDGAADPTTLEEADEPERVRQDLATFRRQA